MNGGVLAFATTIVMLAAIGCGLWPAVRETRGQPYDLLRSGVRTRGAGPAAGVFRRALVAAQVALTLVVLSGAGLLSHTVATLQRVALGYSPSHLVFFRTDFIGPMSAAPRDTAWLAFWETFPDRLEQRLGRPSRWEPSASRPVCRSAAARRKVSYRLHSTPGRRSATPGSRSITTMCSTITSAIWALGSAEAEASHGRTTATVNSSWWSANRLRECAWPDQDPIGHRLRFNDQINSGAYIPSQHPWYTVVGVVPDVRYNDLIGPPHPTMYTAFRQTLHNGWFIWRTPGDPSHMTGAIAAAVAAADHNWAVSELTTGPIVVADRLVRIRAMTTLFSGLAGTALFLAALGLFGVLATYVRERRGELAVRSALGASAYRLRALVVQQTLRVAAIGIGCGIPLALAASQTFRSLVANVQPRERGYTCWNRRVARGGRRWRNLRSHGPGLTSGPGDCAREE